MFKPKLSALLLCAWIATVVSLPSTAQAYVGPGAGFAFLGSTFVFVGTAVLALLTLLFWPLQWLWRRIRGYGVSKNARTARLVIVGLDGLEPKLVEEYMSAGRLPNLTALKSEGHYSRLRTTLPALSPVAWSTFQTGVNPGAHNIFDFLTRDKRNCLPLLSSSRITEGRTRFHRKKTEVEILRKSQPFWKILGKHGIFSNIIRVPISYPPEKFHGNILSAMCTPDLRGTQGSFTLFTSRKREAASEGGAVNEVKRVGDSVSAVLEGPTDTKSGKALTVQLELTLNRSQECAELRVCESIITLKLNQFSDWIPLVFRLGRHQILGIARFCLRELSPEFSLYVSPINIDPEAPVLPISYPLNFSTWLAKKHGLYGTLGLAEDTWGRNEHALDDRRFLDQAYLTHDEREKMFFEALEKTSEGLCVCVFDASDRIQHMFWRYLDADHPAAREGSEFSAVIPEMYQKMDALVGKVRGKLNPEDVLVILSDHGFSSFRRGVNLNTWLLENGYLVLKDGRNTGAEYLQDVDWERTRAYAIGLAGLYINRRGRERFGSVEPRDAEGLKREIATKLETLKDPEGDVSSISKVYDTVSSYRGLYVDEAPDLIVGYNPGYRVSWESITGKIEAEVFSDNIKAWSGDHHIDPELIPGVLFANRQVTVTDPHLADLAPTALDLFAIKVPAYMEGRVII